MIRKRINITLDDTLYKRIQETAIKEHRSASNMIEFILYEYVNRPGVNSTPYQLHYPEGVRSTSPIPETPYKITCDSTTQQEKTKPQQETTKPRPKYKTVIGGPEDETNKTIESTPMRSYTSTKTADGHSKHPLVWLDENDIDPNDLSESSYNILTAQYPDVSINDFVNYQHQRQNRYTPDPNDPYDVMTNNPYLRNR